MQTLSSMSPSLGRYHSPRSAHFDRTSGPVFAVAAAIATLIVVASISFWVATSNSNSTPTRTVSTKAASGLTVEPASPVVRSANAAEQPITVGVIRSTNAAELNVAQTPAAVGHTAHVPPTPLPQPSVAGHFQ